MSQLFTWGGQSTGVSALASFLPKKSQGWFRSEWTGWISLKSKGLSRVFSNTTVQKHQFFVSQLSSESNSQLWVSVRQWKVLGTVLIARESVYGRRIVFWGYGCYLKIEIQLILAGKIIYSSWRFFQLRSIAYCSDSRNLVKCCFSQGPFKLI